MSEYTLVSSVDRDEVEKIYRIIKPAHHYVGFCGYLWQVIRAIYKYPNDKYYIFIGNSQWGSVNVWDFYFKQPHIEKSPPSEEVISEVGLLFDEESEFVDVYPCMLKMTPEERQQRRENHYNIVKKYFNLQWNIQQKIDAFKKEHFEGKSVLGFHSRGTDHPDKKDISASFETIDAKLNEHDLMFASSDEKEIIEALKKRYGNRMVTYDSTTRSDECNFQMPRTESEEPTHAFRYNAIINWTRENEGYKIGEDIVVETHLLSSTNFLLCACNSNVNYFVRALNAFLPYHIIYTPKL